jgi:integrase
MSRKLTEQLVASIPVTGRDSFVFDSTEPGFAVRVTPAGAKLFIAQCRANGPKRRATIGRFPDITVAEARRQARVVLDDLRAGLDPKVEQATREQARAAGATTVAMLADRWLAEYVKLQCKASTADSYQRVVDRHIKPKLGHLAVAAVDKSDVMKLHVGMAGTPRLANYTVAVLRSMLHFAEDHKLRPRGSNPARRVKPYREARKERFLSETEIGKAADAITAAERSGHIGPFAAAGLRLCLLTGARSGEIASTTWKDVDFGRRVIVLRDHKTDRGGEPRVIYLPEAAIEVLRALPRVGKYVIAGATPDQPFKTLTHTWIRRVRADAGLKDVRLHDLRHSFASLALARGVGLPMIGKLLGHKQAQTTQRYSHLARDAAAAVADEIGAAYEQAIAKATEPGATVVKLPRRRRRSGVS